MGVCKGLVRTAVIGGVVVTGAALVAGPDRISALFDQTRSEVVKVIDDSISDPVALRAQLRKLESQYPARISDVRSDLEELKRQSSQLKRDLAVSRRVVALAGEDIARLETGLERADAARVQNASLGEGWGEIVVVFDGDRLTPEEVSTKLASVRSTRDAYEARADDIDRDLGYLSRQERQLENLLRKLEEERVSFQTQLADLDRQVDAIARNDRILEIMEDRQTTIDEQSRYRASSLEQITTRLSDIRAKQESRLESLGAVESRFDYEDQAKRSIDREIREGAGEDVSVPSVSSDRVIEIEADEPEQRSDNGSLSRR